MHQRQLRHLSSGTALAFILALVATLGLAPQARPQGQCPTEFQEQASGAVADQGSVCATAVGQKCTFELALCVNQPGGSCTPKDLKHKTIHASSLCTQGGKVKVKANTTSSVCGSFVGVKVKAKKHGTKCKIKGKAAQAKTRITLDCEPASSPCSTATSTTTTTIPQGCACPTSNFHQLSFTTGIGSG